MNFDTTHDAISLYVAKWLTKTCNFKISVANIRCKGFYEQPDVFAINSYGRSVVIEVKVSRSDFLNDKNKKFRKMDIGMGDYRIYCCMPGVVKDLNEIPEGWGLIEISGKNTPRFKILKGKKPSSSMNYRPNQRTKYFEKDIELEQRLLVSILNRSIMDGSNLQRYSDGTVYKELYLNEEIK